MNISYYDKFNNCEVSKYNVKVGCRYLKDIKVPKKMIVDAWKFFILDVNELKSNARKIGRNEYFEQTIEVDRINYTLPSEIFNRTFLTKLPYLYDDLKTDGKFIFPIFMKSIYDKNGGVKIVQVGGNGKILILDRYFSNKKIDIFISNRNTDTNEIENFCKIFNEDGHLQVFLEKYSDNDEYYVECIEIVSQKNNFFDRTLESLELWEYIYNTVIDFEITNIKDYKILLDKIVLDGQKFIQIT
jgi:hypothetical protein